jgi:hypothetical protein
VIIDVSQESERFCLSKENIALANLLAPYGRRAAPPAYQLSPAVSLGSSLLQMLQQHAVYRFSGLNSNSVRGGCHLDESCAGNTGRQIPSACRRKDQIVRAVNIVP